MQVMILKGVQKPLRYSLHYFFILELEIEIFKSHKFISSKSFFFFLSNKI